jgi:hypothetical protein
MGHISGYFITKIIIQSEEDLEAAMEEASITAPHARNAVPAQVVTITEAAQAGSTEVQVVVREQKKGKQHPHR